jgi:flagellar assembly protein FliH
VTDGFRKFDFDREFAPDGRILREGDTFKRVYTEEEMQMVAEQAAEAARQVAEIEAQEAAAEAAGQVVHQVSALLGRMQAESEAMREDAARLALAAARIIAGAALEQYGEDTLKACITEALSDLRGEPRIAVRVNPSLSDALAEVMEGEAAQRGMEGALIVRADADIARTDCVLEWRSGAIERTTQDIEARIEQAVKNWLAQPLEADADATPDQAALGGQAQA